MSYLRPTCSDAAALVTNRNISRYLPGFLHGETQSEHATATATTTTTTTTTTTRTHVSSEQLEHPQRLPSQRPLDRRWDESRGLVFAKRTHALKNHTWTPRRCIVFAGSIGQRKSYATRPLGSPASAPKPASEHVYNSGAYASLEKPTEPDTTLAPKGAKQLELEKEVSKQATKMSNLKKEFDDLKKESLELKVRSKELDLKMKADEVAFKKDKERIYEKGMQDAKDKAVQAVKLQIQKLETETTDLRQQLHELRDGEARVKGAAKVAMTAGKRELDAKEQEMWTKLNRFDDESKQTAKERTQKLEERAKAIQRKEDGLRTRKMQRSDYNAYRSHYDVVHEEHKIMGDKLKIVLKQLAQEKAHIDTLFVKAKGAESDTTEIARLRDARSQLKALEKEVTAVRDELLGADESLRAAGHKSRINTNTTRFEDTSLAAEAMSAGLYTMSINPLRSAKVRTQKELEKLDAQVRSASNATLREELMGHKDALSAQWATLFSATDLAFLDRDLQVLETLQLEPYAHKAVYIATRDTKADLDRKAQLAYDGKSTGMGKSEWKRNRDALERITLLVKQRAQILEFTGKHAEDERELDKEIKARIADAHNDVQSKIAQLFGNHKQARSAAKRLTSAPVRARSAPPASSSFTRKPATPTRSTKSSKPARARTTIKKQAGREDQDRSHKVGRLRTLLEDPAVTMDPQMRSEVTENLIAHPKTESDLALHDRLMIQGLRRRRDRAAKYLEDGYDPATKASQEDDSAQKASQEDVAVPSTPPTQLDLERQMQRLKGELLNPTLKKKEKSDLVEQFQQINASLNEKHIQNLHARKAALGPKSPDNDEALANIEIEIKRKTLSLAKPRTRRERMSRPTVKHMSFTSREEPTLSTPKTNGLSMTPTMAKQAAHVPHPRRHSHGDFHWTLPLRERQSLDGPAQPWIHSQATEYGEPSSADVATPVNGGGNVGLAYGFSDAGPVSSTKCVVSDDVSGTSAEAAHDDNAKSHVQPAPTSLSAETFNPSPQSNTPEFSNNMTKPEEETILTYEIPLKDKRNALIASRNSTASFWKYSLYKNAAGETPTRHYCTTFEQSKDQIAKFTGEKVVGFDLEWEKWHSKPGEDSAKRCVSLMQVAAEDKVALFHLALFRGGDSAEDLLPPALRTFLENPEIIKVGVNIGNDATRLRKCSSTGFPRARTAHHSCEGTTPAPTKPRRAKQPVEVPEELEDPDEPTEESAVLQEEDDGESSDDFFDAPEDLAALDAYMESQDAAAAIAGASRLPEITYPTLPSLEEDASHSSSDFDDTSSLPDDPLTKPTTTTSSRTPTTSSRTPTTFHSPEAAAADEWATAWQSQLPAGYITRVGKPHLRAYHLWHHQGFSLGEITALLRKEPLALTTVVSYVAEAVQKEDLEFDGDRVREIRARLPTSVRARYGKLYAEAGKGEE